MSSSSSTYLYKCKAIHTKLYNPVYSGHGFLFKMEMSSKNTQIVVFLFYLYQMLTTR